jgi:hypothetical protein
MAKYIKVGNPGYMFLGMVILSACSATVAIFAIAKSGGRMGIYMLAASVILVSAPLGGVVGQVFLGQKGRVTRK